MTAGDDRDGSPSWEPMDPSADHCAHCAGVHGVSKGWVFVECRHLGQTDRLMPL